MIRALRRPPFRVGLNVLRGCTRSFAKSTTDTNNNSNLANSDSSRIRNIGIVAHIDAGKTTTTERMLYYSGLTAQMGEVHDGDTVMDWMAQERERGITITSASAAIDWLKHRINLIDTPGHVDFTFEVERSLSVLDGAVVILDASAGVQAQTLKVWQQANRYGLPRLVYLNKMDKPNASIPKCLDSIKRRLSIQPLQLQLPLTSPSGQFTGLIDIVSGLCYAWPLDQGVSEEGKLFNVEYLLPGSANTVEGFLSADERTRYTEQLLSAREGLIGELADLNGALAERVLESEHLNESITAPLLHRAIREATLEQTAVPLLVGSSYRNIGVQPLLDAVVRYLPAPLESSRARAIHDACDSFSALAFKITTDKRLGPLTYLRVYSGSLPVTGSPQQMYNLNRETSERITRIYRPFADHFADLSKTNNPTMDSAVVKVTIGDIIVVSGLTATITGDTLVVDSKNQKSTHTDQPVLAGIEVPEPVYYCSLESPSLSKMKQLEIALEQLQREDPSFKVLMGDKERSGGASMATSSNQIVIKGMGELHIEIIKDRIKREYGIEVHTGPLQISYQESITESTIETVDLCKSIGGVSNQVRLSLELRPSVVDGTVAFSTLRRKDLHIRVINTKENNLAGELRPWHLKWIHAGVYKALQYGPLFGFPVVNVDVNLHEFTTNRRTLEPFIVNAATQCTLEALRQSAPLLLEPIMRLEISTPEAYIGPILSDLSGRRCEFGDSSASSSTSGGDDQRQLVAFVPLAELPNYSTVLRSLSSGMATFDMALHSYRAMDQTQMDRAIRVISGVDY